jgi:hypothetical protein
MAHKETKADCPNLDLNHHATYCPHCDPEAYILSTEQYDRIAVLIKRMKLNSQ